MVAQYEERCKTRHRGTARVGWMFTLAATAYNLVRIPLPMSKNAVTMPIAIEVQERPRSWIARFHKFQARSCWPSFALADSTASPGVR